MSRLPELIAVKSPAPEPLDVTVHDRIIVGKKGHASLSGLKLIQAGVRFARADMRQRRRHVGQ